MKSFFLVCCGLILVLQTSCHREKLMIDDLKKMNIEELSIKVSSLKTEQEKLDFCIYLIDAGIISVGKNISNVKKIWGDEFNEFSDRGIIYFRSLVDDSKLDAKGNNTESSGNGKSTNIIVPSEISEGWYIIIFFNQDKTIQCYYLSNLDKVDVSCIMQKKATSPKTPPTIPSIFSSMHEQPTRKTNRVTH